MMNQKFVMVRLFQRVFSFGVRNLKAIQFVMAICGVLIGIFYSSAQYKLARKDSEAEEQQRRKLYSETTEMNAVFKRETDVNLTNASINRVEGVRNQLNDQGENQSVIQELAGKPNFDGQVEYLKLHNVVEILDALGQDFCDGSVFGRHIISRLTYEIAQVCYSKQVNETYKFAHKHGCTFKESTNIQARIAQITALSLTGSLIK